VVKDSILGTIGNTPLVKIGSMNPNKRVTLMAKMESANPTGSLKDRVAYYIISKAEEEGVLTRDKVILESTSGNMGISLGMVAAVKGYKVAVTLLESASFEKRSLLECYGVEVFLIPAEKGPDGARNEAMMLYNQYPEKYFLVGQNFNINNVLAHYETTGREIWEGTNGEVDYFVAGIGTSGTIIGVGKRLKELKPEVKVIGVEPYPNHKIYGLKNFEQSRIPEIYDQRWVDEVVKVSDEEAIKTARELVNKEGILAGVSSGAVMFAALEKIKVLDKGKMVALLADSGERYLSTGFYTGK